MKLLQKKIPTIIGVFLLLVGAITGVVLISRDTGFIPRAAPEFIPNNVTISNITDNAFSISWTTEAATTGSVSYGTSPSSLNTVKRDDRDDLSGSINSYQTHHVTIRGLSPESTYYAVLGSGESSQQYDNNGQPFSITTGPVLNTPPPADTAYGQVITSANTPADGSIVYLNLAGSGSLSTLVKQSGQWAISLSTARTTNLGSYITYDPQNTPINITVQGPAGQTSQITATTANDQPVPTITLGQNTQTDPIAPSQPIPSSSPTLQPPATSKTSGFIITPLNQTPASDELEFLNPTKDGEALNTTQPEFLGTGPSGATITITVNSNHQIIDTVIVGANNTWSWTPPTDLEPGEHTITIEFLDPSGIIQSLTRSFTVYAAGESDDPAFTATPSASTNPTPTPTPTPKPSASPSPSPSPIGQTSQPSTQSGVPQPGNMTPTLFIFALGSLIITIGLTLKKSI